MIDDIERWRPRLVDPGQEQAAGSAVAGTQRTVQVITRDVVQCGEASSDSVVRTRLCLLAARRGRPAGFVQDADLECIVVLESLARQGYDAVVLDRTRPTSKRPKPPLKPARVRPTLGRR